MHAHSVVGKNEQHHLAKTDENSALPTKTYDLKQGQATDMDWTLHTDLIISKYYFYTQ